MSDEFVAEVLAEVELTKGIIECRFWLRDILASLDLYKVYQWEPGEKIQVVWQRKVWPKGDE